VTALAVEDVVRYWLPV